MVVQERIKTAAINYEEMDPFKASRVTDPVSVWVGAAKEFYFIARGPITESRYSQIIDKLNNANLVLKRPINVKIEIDENDGDFIATIPNLRLYSWASSREKAVDEMKSDIEKLYIGLTATPDTKLGKKMREIKHELMNVIEKKSGAD
jgi:hypothetical protein